MNVNDLYYLLEKLIQLGKGDYTIEIIDNDGWDGKRPSDSKLHKDWLQQLQVMDNKKQIYLLSDELCFTDYNSINLIVNENGDEYKLEKWLKVK